MKIITFWGGLGNQIFEYAYYKWLQEKYPNENIYGYYPAIGLAAHNGLEINKRFEVELPRTSKMSNIIGGILFNMDRICRRLHLPLVITCTQINEKYNAIFHCDYWQDKKYELPGFKMRFKISDIDRENLDLLSKMEGNNTVAIHIRRGDFLSPTNKVIFGGICTDEYYKHAISKISENVDNPLFIFFSDDSQYVRDTFKMNNMIIVDWNKGEKNIYDMYLMSKCKYMILANSTFSYWAARLNENAAIVICPNRWSNINPPNIILNKWLKI